MDKHEKSESQREQEDWEDLISSKGWQRLQAHFHKELHTEFEDRVSALVKKGGDLVHIQQLVAARDYVDQVFHFPELRLEQLEQADAKRGAYRPGDRRGSYL